MNCLSLLQPWASAIALGLKTIETRGWSAPVSAIGKPLAIAASINHTKKERAVWMKLKKTPAYAVFVAHGILDWEDLPKGVVVCTSRLVGSYSTNEDPPKHLKPGPFDEMLGDFSADRFAWFLDSVARLKTPVPIKGRLGIYQWEESA